jgi:hypothetical protein
MAISDKYRLRPPSLKMIGPVRKLVSKRKVAKVTEYRALIIAKVREISENTGQILLDFCQKVIDLKLVSW